MKRGLFMNKKDNEAEILIYEQIGADWYGEGVTAKRFADDLRAMGDVSAINVRINSPGGDVFDGLAIYTQLTQHKAPVNVFIDGLAASAASFIAMAGDTIKIAENGMFMIHKAWSMAVGNSDDMMKVADTLSKVDDTIALTLQKRSGQTEDDIRKWMKDETWMSGQEAVDRGFADGLMEAKKVEARFKMLASFKNAPDSLTAKEETASQAFDEVAYMRQRLNLLMKSA